MKHIDDDHGYINVYTASHDSVEVKTKSGVTTTEIELTDLVPFLKYTFSVTAENAVSPQDTNINARTTIMTAFTREGGEISTSYMHSSHQQYDR